MGPHSGWRCYIHVMMTSLAASRRNSMLKHCESAKARSTSATVSKQRSTLSKQHWTFVAFDIVAGVESSQLSAARDFNELT